MAMAPMPPANPAAGGPTELRRRRQIAELAKARVHSERARQVIDFVLGLRGDPDT
jgi:hypothetical protein